MFVPVSYLVQQESRIETGEDVVKVLDRYILPNYPNFTTANVTMTKMECMGVLYSFQSAGKLHFRLKPEEIETAVDAFLEDRFWLDSSVVKEATLAYDKRPRSWMLQPNLFTCIGTIPKVVLEAISVTWELITIGVMSTVYRFYKVRELNLPKMPTTNRPVSSAKKDN